MALGWVGSGDAEGLTRRQHQHVTQEARPQWKRAHGGCLGEEQSFESVLCPAMSSYDSAKHQLTNQILTLAAKLELPPVQEFITLSHEPPGEHNEGA